MLKSVLHVLSQRPGRTGSGVMLDSIVRCAQERDWEQHVIVGTPADDPSPQVGDLPEKQIHPLAFSTDELPFALPGMSDVMPYVSSRFSALSGEQIAIYQTRWKKHIAEVVDAADDDGADDQNFDFGEREEGDDDLTRNVRRRFFVLAASRVHHGDSVMAGWV